MKKIALLQHPESRYGVLQAMTHELQEALIRADVLVSVFDLSDFNEVQRLAYEAQRDGFDCTLAINLLIGESLYTSLKIPHLMIGVDSYCYYEFPKPCNHIIPLFIDKTSCSLFSKEFSLPSFWCPHAIAKNHIESGRKLTESKRPMDFVFLGSFFDYEYEEKRWREIFSHQDVALIVEHCEKLLENQSPIFPSVEKFVTEHRLLDNVAISMKEFAISVDRYIRGKDRENLLFSLKPYPIHVFTFEEDILHWSKKKGYEHCIFHKSVQYDELPGILASSTYVLNSAPHIHQGFHERLFLALAYGACVITNQNLLLPSWLEQNGYILPYTKKTLPNIKEALFKKKSDFHHVLDWLENEHTWDKRLKETLTMP